MHWKTTYLLPKIKAGQNKSKFNAFLTVFLDFKNAILTECVSEGQTLN